MKPTIDELLTTIDIAFSAAVDWIDVDEDGDCVDRTEDAPHAPDCSCNALVAAAESGQSHQRTSARGPSPALVRQIADMRELLSDAIGVVEGAHYKCDLASDDECSGEQYGDGRRRRPRPDPGGWQVYPMNTLIDINVQLTGSFAVPLDDPDKAAQSAATFAFAVNTGTYSWRTATSKDGNIRHTPIVLGDGYPTIVASVMHRRVPKYEYHVSSIGYGDDFDKALLAAIAGKHGMGMMEQVEFAEWCGRILRPSTVVEKIGQ